MCSDKMCHGDQNPSMTHDTPAGQCGDARIPALQRTVLLCFERTLMPVPQNTDQTIAMRPAEKVCFNCSVSVALADRGYVTVTHNLSADYWNNFPQSHCNTRQLVSVSCHHSSFIICDTWSRVTIWTAAHDLPFHLVPVFCDHRGKSVQTLSNGKHSLSCCWSPKINLVLIFPTGQHSWRCRIARQN